MVISGIEKGIQCKNESYIKSIRHPTIANEQLYEKYRNNLHTLLKQAEKDHYDVSFIDSKSNIIKSCEIITGIINKNKCSRIIDKFLINILHIANGKRKANGVNDFYENIEPMLASKIGNTDIDPTDYAE